MGGLPWGLRLLLRHLSRLGEPIVRSLGPRRRPKGIRGRDGLLRLLNHLREGLHLQLHRLWRRKWAVLHRVLLLKWL